MPAAAEQAFWTEQVSTGESAAILARRQWRALGGDLDKWPSIVDRLTSIVAAHQIDAAAAGVRYAAGQVGEPVAKVSAAAFGGWASDGLPLDSLLYGAVVKAREKFGSGVGDDQVLLAGQRWLERAVRVQVADAGRVATGTAITATPNAGWVRYVNLPCCQRCAVLAGKFFRWNQGFQRHHGCNCVHRPVSEDAPDGYSADIQPGQIHDLTEAQRRAIADGADMNQVINAYRSVSPSQRTKMITTTEGTTRRGWASYVRRRAAQLQGQQINEAVRLVGRRGVIRNYPERRIKARPTPELIYAKDLTRDEAVQVLARFGYIVGDLNKVARLGL